MCTTEKLTKRYKQFKGLSYFLFLFGLVYLSIIFHHGSVNFEFIGQLIEPIFLIFSAFIIFFFTRKQIHDIEGNYFETGHEKLTIYQKQQLFEFNADNKPLNIKIHLKTIEISTTENKTIVINLDHYSLATVTRINIKEQFKSLRERFLAH